MATSPMTLSLTTPFYKLSAINKSKI